MAARSILPLFAVLVCSASALPNDQFSLVQQALTKQGPMAFLPFGNMAPKRIAGVGMSVLTREPPCPSNGYFASNLETSWRQNANSWTNLDMLCDHLANHTEKWIEAAQGNRDAGSVFSRICKPGTNPQLIEPLAGVLRDPRYICTDNSRQLRDSTTHLLLADAHSIHGLGKRKLFDAGGKKFVDSLNMIISNYSVRGVNFDEIHVWEPRRRGLSWYFRDTPREKVKVYEQIVDLKNGMGVKAELGSADNVVEMIWNNCRPMDFCSLKLDSENPEVDRALVQQLLSSPSATRDSLDELFFKNRVHGLMEDQWPGLANGTYADSYELFTKLRKIGVRAHPWV